MGGRRRKQDGQVPAPVPEVEVSPGLPRGFEPAYDDPRGAGPAPREAAWSGHPDTAYGDDAPPGGPGDPWTGGGHGGYDGGYDHGGYDLAAGGAYDSRYGDPAPGGGHGTGYDGTGYDGTGYDGPGYDGPGYDAAPDPVLDPGTDLDLYATHGAAPAVPGREATGRDVTGRDVMGLDVAGRDATGGEVYGRGRAEPVVPAPRGAADDLGEPPRAPAPRTPSVPIWHPPGPVPAALTGALAVLLAVTALAGGPAPLLGAAVLQVVTAAGWFRLNGMWPARQGIALAAVAGFAALGAVELAGADALRVVPGVLAGAIGLVLVQQLIRRDGRAELMPALTVTASATLVTVLDVAYVFAVDLERPGVDSGAVVAAGVLAVAAAVLVASMPVPAVVGAIGGFAAGTAIGAGAGIVLGLGSDGALLAAGAAVAGLAGRAVSGYDHPSRFVHMTAGVALPLALAAPVVYLLGRVVVG